MNNEAIGPRIEVTRFPYLRHEAITHFRITAAAASMGVSPLVPYPLSQSSSSESVESPRPLPTPEATIFPEPFSAMPLSNGASPFKGRPFEANYDANRHPLLSRFEHFPQWQSGYRRWQNRVGNALSPVKQRAALAGDYLHGGAMSGILSADAWLSRLGGRAKAK